MTRCTTPSPTATPRWRSAITSLLAGTVSGLVARCVGDYLLIGLLHASAMGLVPLFVLYAVLSDDHVFIIALILVALVAGWIGSFVGYGLSTLVARQPADAGRSWRRVVARYGLLGWPTAALGGLWAFDDVMSGLPYGANALLLWAISGAVLGILAWWRVRPAGRERSPVTRASTSDPPDAPTP